MSSLILKTKLRTPPLRPDLINRPRLIRQLDEGLKTGARLTLISGPAGFGKTTLLSQWVSGCGRQVAWVSLDKGDNDPNRFLLYLASALQGLKEPVGESVLVMLQSPQAGSLSFDSLLTGLINEISVLQSSCVLVLDDYHVISEQSVHEAILFLLENLPSQLHVVLASRADPPWPLARFRARRELNELRGRELRFTPEEVGAFLTSITDLDLTSGEIEALEARTEGWIAGLQMAALSMQGRQDVAGFIKGFSGSHRFILDYLVEEVLDRQSVETKEFLLQTSVLERMSAPLCHAVTGRSDCQQMLTQLEQSNLFLVALDDERHWYRYHHLFSDLLRTHLEQREPDLVATLHRRATDWYEENGLIAESVDQALTAGDSERAARLIEQHALALIYHGGLATLLKWQEQLPEETMQSRPWLYVALAWGMVNAGQADETDLLVQRVYATLASTHDLSTTEIQRIEGHLFAIQCYGAWIKGEMAHSVELARKALALLTERDLLERAWSAGILGAMLRDLGQMEEAERILAEALATSLAAGNIHFAVDTLWEKTVLEYLQGKFHKVMSTCEEALRLADEYSEQGGRHLPAIGYIYTRMASIFYEWNDLEAALSFAQQGVEISQRWGMGDAIIQGLLRLASAWQALGDREHAMANLHQAWQMAETMSPWYCTIVATWQTRIQLAFGDFTAVANQAQKLKDNSSEHHFQRLLGAFNSVRVLIFLGRQGTRNALTEALDTLAQLQTLIMPSGAKWFVIEYYVLLAMAFHAQRDMDHALEALERALSLSEPEKIVRVFVNEGAPMADLLRKALTQGISMAYVTRLLEVLEPDDTKVISVEKQSVLVEPLSEREMEVLRLLTTSMSSTEIAAELIIAPSTVRSHIKSIYSKLEVHNRMEAVNRSSELGLI